MRFTVNYKERIRNDLKDAIEINMNRIKIYSMIKPVKLASA